MLHKIRFITDGITQKERNTLTFAAKELQRYLGEVSDEVFSIIPSSDYNPDEDALYLGINLSDKLLNVDDKSLDDAILIETNCLTGLITGTNPCSVLIAAYRFLKELGFAFLHPGKNGEYYPDAIESKKVYVCEKASYRHRGICIEGSVYQKYLTDIIDWIPKASMNGYFVQFQLPRVFFDRFYMGESPYRGKTKLSDDDIRSFVSLAEDEIEKRSLQYHGVGHGWTTQAFGIDGSSWSEHDEPEEEYRDVLAEINGKRLLWKGVPLNTNLCYSKAKARDRVTDNIVKYCKEHDNVTYLHFWLADGSNNNCECDNCRQKRTSDYYVMMLNELDAKLEAEGLDTKIVFLVYVDLLWKPLYERFKNSNRFVLMFAPIRRSYTSSFGTATGGEMKPYELNKLDFPTGVADNLAYLRDWQNDFNCDSFDFDYHFMWDHYYDFAQYHHAHVVYEDIKNLSAVGLNGFISCQIQRAFLPTSLNMNVLASTLWNKNLSFEEISDTILSTEFGAKYSLVQKYLAELSEHDCAEAIRGEKPVATEEMVKNLTHSVEIIKDFESVIKAEIASAQNEQILWAWQKLEFHAKLYSAMLDVYIRIAKGEEVNDCDKVKDIAFKSEMRFKDEFDAMHFIDTFETRTIPKLYGRFEGA